VISSSDSDLPNDQKQICIA